jgi:hypothetical protein
MTEAAGGDTSDDRDAAEDEAAAHDGAVEESLTSGDTSIESPPALTRKSTRIRAAPDYFDPSAYVGASTDVLTDDPQSLSQVMKRPDWELWESSMNDELTSLLEKQVYTWADLPADRKALPSRWVFKLKRTQDGAVDKYKSRIVAKGFMQKEGVDYTEVFAPGSSLSTLRLLLSIAAKHDLHIHQLDVKTAFLNGELVEEVYLMPPEGVQRNTGKVWRLHKALYGLKQAAQAWFAKLKSRLLSVGFELTLAYPCLYSILIDESKVFLLVHVDDALIVGTEVGVARVKQIFCSLFDARDLGEATLFLGLQVIRNRANGVLWLGQTQYANNILKTYAMVDCSSRVSPLDTNCQLSLDGNALEPNVPYSALVGSLLYLAVCTRPDLSHAVNMLARFIASPKLQHWQAAKGVLRYLRGTADLGVRYLRDGGDLLGYSDADYAEIRSNEEVPPDTCS